MKRPSLIPHSWDTSNRIGCRVTFQWEPIGRIVLDDRQKVLFPDVAPAPGLYRFSIRTGPQMASYVGETEDLQRRFQGYRTPGVGQITNVRIRDRMVQALDEDGEIAVAVVRSGAVIEVDGQPTSADLSNKSIRLIIENVALLAAHTEEIVSLNR